ncbi:MAG: hypothetical protein GX272_08080 [Epulopiscium sp.]|nr:hypothetical protein [Candidatus Epulonipiscium sp.]
MSLKVLTSNPKACCPTPLECGESLLIQESGIVWESHIPIKGTFVFDGFGNPAPVTIRIYQFNGRIVTRILEPAQSFVFTGDNVRKIEVFVSNGPSSLVFGYCTQTLTNVNCKNKNSCCPESLLCTTFSSTGDIPANEDYLLWQSTVPVNGSFEFTPFFFGTGQFEVKLTIKRFNKPDVIETITQSTVIRSSDMKALFINIPPQADPPVLNVRYCLQDQVNEKLNTVFKH